jgi:pyridoxal phosphate enzyme (YggS family)
MIRDNLLRLKGELPAGVTLVAVTKGRTAAQIREAVAAGATDIGENRVQEALEKYPDLRLAANALRPIKLHMIGHLQSNKVKDAVKLFDLIHSVDSIKLAQAIDKEAGKINKAQDILIEVKVSPEEAKYGFAPEEVEPAWESLRGFKNLSVKGLMCVAPIVGDPEEARPYFKKLKRLYDSLFLRLKACGSQPILSMGMSDDFRIAVEEGANMVRIGRAIFDE